MIEVINTVLTIIMIHAAYVFYLKKEKKIAEHFNIDEVVKNFFKTLFFEKRDRAVVDDKLAPPEQRVEKSQYPYPNNMFWEKTRGEPDNYQLVGLLYNKDINKNYQLFGRRIYPGAYEWEYYILGKDVGGLEIKFPIQTKNKEQIMDGTQLTIPIDSNVYTVSIYNYDTPRYNPYPYSVNTGQYIPTDYGKF